MKSNEAVYRGYIHPDARINWTSNEDVMKKLLSVNLLDNKRIDKGGLPIISDGKKCGY